MYLHHLQWKNKETEVSRRKEIDIFTVLSNVNQPFIAKEKLET